MSDIEALQANPVEHLVVWQRALAHDPAESTTEWARAVSTRLSVSGGELLVAVGGSVAASFEALELEDTLELCMELLADAAKADLDVAIGIATGTLSPHGGGPAPGPAVSGAAIDRAQVLASWGRDGELIVDEATHAHAAERFLFGRAVRAPGARGYALDLRHPRRRDCRVGLAFVRQPPLLGSPGKAAQELSRLASAGGVRRVVLRSGMPHTALGVLAQVESEHAPRCILRLEPVGGGLAPLGALSLALRQLTSDWLAGDDREALRAIRDGHAIDRELAATSLAALLCDAAAAGSPAWLVLHRGAGLDRASLRVLLEAVDSCDAQHLMCLTLGRQTRVPSAFARDTRPHEIDVGLLAPDERTQTAAAVLGVDPGSSLAKRVAVLGGATAAGIVEAARTLVGAGDLIHQSDGFIWRTLPRSGTRALPVSALLTERLAGLETAAHRVMEALVVAPPRPPLALIDRVLSLDGLAKEDAARGLSSLEVEGWVADGSLGVLDAEVRSALLDEMPPARTAELHRFVAEALAPSLAPGRGFDRGLVAYHMARGGLEAEGARELVTAARAAADHGFDRTALQLAALALEWDESDHTRGAAQAIARSVDQPPQETDSLVPEPGPEPEPDAEDDAETLATGAIGSAIGAIARGDADGAEHFLDAAMAAGWTRAGAQRLLSLAHLTRGDVHEAARTLRQSHVAHASDAVRAREAVTAALIHLQSGDTMEAIRSGLLGLSLARELGERRGIGAALTVLSASYQALGREQDAQQLATAAATALA